MKHIQKAGCPHAYSQWCTAFAGQDKADWREVPATLKAAILGALIAEQGSLCAYTMRRIDSGSAHVEHIKPQSRCREDLPGSDLDYENLVACFPREGMKATYRYGAQKKGGWWEKDGTDFVSPLHPSCERRFHFDLNGNITATNNQISGLTTIKVLGLSHKSIVEERKRAIEEFIYGPRGDDPLSRAKAQSLQKAICDRDVNGRFYVFCVAIRDALSEYMMILHKNAQRRKAMRRKS